MIYGIIYVTILISKQQFRLNEGGFILIQVQHQRAAFRHAITFLTLEIGTIERDLNESHLLDVTRELLGKRLVELKKELVELESYNLHT